MSEIKRKRFEDHYDMDGLNENQGRLAALLQQPYIPVISSGDQIIQAEQLQVMDNNGQNSNMVYVLLPSDANQAENLMTSVPTVFIMPKSDETNAGETIPQLHYYEENKLDVDRKEGDLIIKDVRTLKNEDNFDCKVEPEQDPLSIQQDNFIIPQDLPGENFCIINNGNIQTLEVVGPTNIVEPFKYRSQFKCDYVGCRATFTTPLERRLHLDVHIFPSNSEFKCNICNMVFETALERNKHVESHAVPNTYRCKSCMKSFPYYTTLVKHVNEEKCVYMCNYCGIQFSTSRDLCVHEKMEMQTCVCHTKICNAQAYSLHISLCPMFKQKMKKSKKKFCGIYKRNSDEVIVLD